MFQGNGIPGVKTGSNRTGGPFGPLWVVWGNSEAGRRVLADMKLNILIRKYLQNNDL